MLPLEVGVSEELAPGDPPRIGPYRIIRRLGSGGLGQVFLGRSAGGRPVAVKVIHADLAGPVPWLATVYVAGPSLAAAVAAHGPLPPASVVMLAAGLAESLTSIHAAGVVHRDLRPSNILLADDGPRVIDFGISQAAAASGLTQTAFMSPEQAEGQAGPPSDVFSFGAVLTFAAAGYPPSAMIGPVRSGTARPSSMTSPPRSARWSSAALAAADGNGRVYVWDVTSGDLAASFAGPGSQGVNGVAFSPDGELQAAADGSGRVYLWRASSAPGLLAAEASELT
jgi:serine/threonine protein kinase